MEKIRLSIKRLMAMDGVGADIARMVGVSQSKEIRDFGQMDSLRERSLKCEEKHVFASKIDVAQPFSTQFTVRFSPVLEIYTRCSPLDRLLVQHG